MAATNRPAASCQLPRPTPCSAPVASTPAAAKLSNNNLRRARRSAIAPSSGASSAISSPAAPLARPSRNVVVVGSVPTLQYNRKKVGKNPAITVVVNPAAAQSYSAQDSTGRSRYQRFTLHPRSRARGFLQSAPSASAQESAPG